MISIPDAEMPVSVSGSTAEDTVDVYDVIECARAIKAHCEAAEDCRTCAFGRCNGNECKLALSDDDGLAGLPEGWEV